MIWYDMIWYDMDVQKTTRRNMRWDDSDFNDSGHGDDCNDNDNNGDNGNGNDDEHIIYTCTQHYVYRVHTIYTYL